MSKVNPTGQLLYFRSSIDGLLQPTAVCATGATDAPMPVILIVHPGGNNLEGCVQDAERIAAFAAAHGEPCVVIRPTGRGKGTVYQNYGEVDLFEALECVARHYPIDRDHISVHGSSMGGAATFYLLSHYPDVFASGVSFCGYCDYRLWEKPGGLTLNNQPWEVPSWEARSAALLIDNFRHTPMWLAHGEWDRSVGGGVPVEHSRQMARLLGDAGFDCRYDELSKTGHGPFPDELCARVVRWMLRQRKVRRPEHVTFATYWLRHNRSYWVTINQLRIYGMRANVDARFKSSTNLIVRTNNVQILTLGPFEGRRDVGLNLDDDRFEHVDLATASQFFRDAQGGWARSDHDLSGEKSHRCSGPISDMFFDRLLLVSGTIGSDADTHFIDKTMRVARGHWANRNVGVHRGGFHGRIDMDLQHAIDSEVTDDQIADRNLMLYGNYSSNAVLKRYEAQLPLAFSQKKVQIFDKTYTGDDVAVFAVMPHPTNPQRYITILGGATPDALCWASHIDMQLLPDYLVFDRGHVLDWGFWSNQWASPSGITR